MVRWKKILGPGLVLILLGSGCAGLPVPGPEDLPWVLGGGPTVRLEDLKRGRALFAAKCASCHPMHLPGEFSQTHWRGTLDKMQVKAKIDDAERDSILLYLSVFSKDRFPRK